MTPPSAAQFAEMIKAHAHEVGFELIGIAEATKPETLEHFHNWLEAGYAGTMQYLERRKQAYAHPEGVMPGVKTVIMLGLNYRHVDTVEQEKVPARISVYAQTQRDYHHVIREKLKQLSKYMHELNPKCTTRGVVDTAPLLERDFARRAGLGWFGKNTLLINKQQGSFIFLAGLLTDWELPADAPHTAQHCGTCTRCLEACPTDAFVAPYILDARKCISYLTIELRNQPIPLDLREGIGNWIMGCDICQDVCPWNRKGARTISDLFKPVEHLQYVNPLEILHMTEESFQEKFGETPLERPGRVGIVRNLIIALGNTGDLQWFEELKLLLNDASPIIRGAAVHSLWKLAIKNEQQGSVITIFAELRHRENDPNVLSELDFAQNFIK